MASLCSSLLLGVASSTYLTRSQHHRPSRTLHTACTCSHQSEAVSVEQRRRDILAGGIGLCAGLALSPLPAQAEDKKEEKAQITVSNLTTFQRQDQRKSVQNRAETALRAGLTKDDANVALRLLLNDAGTYDINSESGGVNGSIITDEELGRPENKDLKPYVNKLKGIKQKIDKENIAAGHGPYSWADVIVLAAKVTAVKQWNSIKVAQSGLKGGETIGGIFGADFPIKLGRQDVKKADPAGRIPQANAPVAKIQEFMTALGNRDKVAPTGFFAAFQGKPTFWEKPTFLLWTAAQKEPEKEEQRFVADNGQYQGFKADYDRSRRSVTRTNYEVDFVTFFTQLAATGAKFNPDAYLKPIEAFVQRL